MKTILLNHWLDTSIAFLLGVLLFFVIAVSSVVCTCGQDSLRRRAHAALLLVPASLWRVEKKPGNEALCGNTPDGENIWGITFLGSTHLHTPNWHFPLTRHSETFRFSYMKFLSTVSKYLQFLRKKHLEGASRTRTRSVESTVHLPYHYATEGLLTIDGLIWRYIATT